MLEIRPTHVVKGRFSEKKLSPSISNLGLGLRLVIEVLLSRWVKNTNDSSIANNFKYIGAYIFMTRIVK